jgi:hypothetical protein
MGRSDAILDDRRARELEGRRYHPWIRRVGMCLMLAVLGLAMANVFGQRPVDSTARSAAASLSVSSPSRLRGGLLFTSRFTVFARREIAKPTLVLDPGWFQQMTLNAIAPNPNQESSRNGAVSYGFDRLEPGRQLVVWISWQVNPTNLTHRSENVELDDGSRPIVLVRRSLTVFP